MSVSTDKQTEESLLALIFALQELVETRDENFKFLSMVTPSWPSLQFLGLRVCVSADLTDQCASLTPNELCNVARVTS